MQGAAAFLANYHVQIIEFEDFGAPMVRAIDAIGRRRLRADSPSAAGSSLTLWWRHWSRL